MSTRDTHFVSRLGTQAVKVSLFLFAAAFAFSNPAVAGSEVDGGSFLAKKGEANAVIVIGKADNQDGRFVASEIQRYIGKLSMAQLPVVTDDQVPSGKPLIVVGGPQANLLSRRAGESQMVSFAGLKSEGFVVKTIDLDGRPAIIVGGNDASGTLYAGYELLERLGVVFQITTDVIPQQKPDLALPALDVRMEPMAKFRGVLKEEAEGNWYMGLREWRLLIDQMAKLKMNNLQFLIGMGSPWLKFSYKGRVGEIINSPESGYLGWGRETRSWGSSPHSSTATARDVRVGRELFPQEYAGPPEFADVRTPDQAFERAREFLHEIIRYAHQRHVQVCLLPQELSFVPPNLALNLTPEMRRSDKYWRVNQRYCGVSLSPSDPITADIWVTAMNTLIDTYPDADAYGFYTTEHSPDMDDPAVQKILRDNATMRAQLPVMAEIRRQGNVQETIGNPARLLDNDFLQMYLSQQVIERVKQTHPQSQLAVMCLFRGYMLPVLDKMLPKDVWLGNMEECCTTKSVMGFYDGITNRDVFVVPRINDDGDEFHMQLNATEFDEDEMVTGTAKYHLSGIVGWSGTTRSSAYNFRYLADGSWNPQINPRSFYESYLGRLYGAAALDPLLQAFMLLEQNEKALVYWGRSETFLEFMDFSPLTQLRTNVNYRMDPPTVTLQGRERIDEAANERSVKLSVKNLDRAELTKSIQATWGEGSFWKWRLPSIGPQHATDTALTEGENYRQRAAQCRKALEFLYQARAKVLPGAHDELDYVIYKTESFANFLDVLTACYDATVSLDQAWVGLVDRDRAEFGVRLNECRGNLDRADRLACTVAGELVAYADVPEEKYLLLRFNRNVIDPIEEGQKYISDVIAYQQEQTSFNKPY